MSIYVISKVTTRSGNMLTNTSNLTNLTTYITYMLKYNYYTTTYIWWTIVYIKLKCKEHLPNEGSFTNSSSPPTIQLKSSPWTKIVA